MTCEDAGGTVLERHTLVIDRGQDVTLNLGCGNGPSTLADGTRLTGAPSSGVSASAPSVDGIRALFSPAAKLGKPARADSSRGRKFAACTRRATRLGGGERSRSAQRACERRFGL